MRRLFALLLLLAPSSAWAVGAPSDCSGSVGTSAAAVAFPSSGSGPSAASVYLTIQNIHASNTLWVNPVGGTAAASAAGSFELAPGNSMTWYYPQMPPPTTLSVIGSGAGTTYTCAYQ